MNNPNSRSWRYGHRASIEVWLRKSRSPRLRVWLDHHYECLKIQLDCKYNYLHCREVISFDELAKAGPGWRDLVANKINLERDILRKWIREMYHDSGQSRWSTYRAWVVHNNMKRDK
jgi:hypothetical protein